MREWTNDKFPRDGQSGNGSLSAYTLEARHNYSKPITIGGQLFDREWRRVTTLETNTGVGIPTPRYRNFAVREMGLLSWKEANAHRWYLYCLCDQQNGNSLCLETRIVEHEITYEYNSRIVAAYDPMGGDDFGGSVDHPKMKATWPEPPE